VGAVNCAEEFKLCSQKRATRTPRRPSALPVYALAVGEELHYYDDYLRDQKSASSGDAGEEEVATSKGLYEFVSNVPASRIGVTLANIRTPAQAKGMAKHDYSRRQRFRVVFFTTRFDTPVLFKAAAFRVRECAAAAEIRGDNRALADLFGVRSMPALVVLCPSDEGSLLDSEAFTGNLKDFKSVAAWLDDFEGEAKERCAAARKRRDKNMAALKKEAGRLTTVALRNTKTNKLRQYLEALGGTYDDKKMIEKDDIVTAILRERGEASSPSWLDL